MQLRFARNGIAIAVSEVVNTATGDKRAKYSHLIAAANNQVDGLFLVLAEQIFPKWTGAIKVFGFDTTAKAVA